MGTRGAWGFRVGGQDKVTYNHYDSYPTGLGADLIRAMKSTDFEKLHAVGSALRLVGEEDKPTAEEMKKYEDFHNAQVGHGHPVKGGVSWYQLLRQTQGDLEVYLDGQVDVMIDSAGFLVNSLFCEYAYIINLDERTFEFYVGFNKDKDAAGRYAALLYQDYRGVALLDSIRFDTFEKMTEEELLERLQKANEKHQEEKEKQYEREEAERRAKEHQCSRETCSAKSRWILTHTAGSDPVSICSRHLPSEVEKLEAESRRWHGDQARVQLRKYVARD